jgi:hypothetical protein
MKVLLLQLFLLLLMTVFCHGQNAHRQTYLGYAFPAGGSLGQSFEVMLGGRYLRNPEQIIISGEGIRVEIVKHYMMMPRLNGTQMQLLRMQIAQREQELSNKPIPPFIRNAYAKLTEIEIEKESERISNHPLFAEINKMAAQELIYLREIIAGYNSRQPNDQISEQLKVVVHISKNAPPGMRELRLASRAGLSNPIRFQVSQAIEDKEREPNDDLYRDSTYPAIETLPFVMNGQILPGDVDRFMLNVKANQTVVFDLMARRLIPYLADAVPGWFQATLAIYDDDGRRIAFVDDNHGDPDPLFEYTFARAGSYFIEIRDSLYRGGENFVYRLHLSEARNEKNRLRSPDINYAPVDLDYSMEIEPNNTLREAQEITIPRVIVGAIQTPGDSDLYRFFGQKGETVIARIEARKFDSPLDSILRIVSLEGQILAVNDDYVEQLDHLYVGPGMMTHFADSYLSYTLPESGVYVISVQDVQGNGGADYKYRLRISAPIPDFKVWVSPSSLNVGPTGCASLRVNLKRLDGFNGEVTLRIVNPAEGVRLHHAVVPMGQDQIWATVEWPRETAFNAHELVLEAVAHIEQDEITRSVSPCDDTMQAFLWRHLLPAQRLYLAVISRYRILNYAHTQSNQIVELSAGLEVDYVQPLEAIVRNPEEFEFRIKEGPDGISLTHGLIDGSNIRLKFKYDGSPLEASLSGNLIVEVSRNFIQNEISRNALLGVIPAVPYQILMP